MARIHLARRAAAVLLTPRAAGWLALGLWALLVLLWLLSFAGQPVNTLVAQSVAVLGLAATAVAALGLRRFFAPPHRPHGPLLAGLLIVALAVGFAGLGHEVGKGYYTDEGHYLHHANLVNSGQPLTRSFVYPHLLYYLDAFALWLAGLFPRPVAWLAAAVYGVEEPAAVPWLVLRLVTAGLGVLTVVPVFVLARRIAGALAATVAGGLVVFAIHYHQGFQVNTCDVPSAFFATLCLLFVGRLAERERTADYLLAGLTAGLAAAAKYPAGVVAVAIVAVYLVHRIRRRRFGWGLAWAGLAALGTFVVLQPSLVVFPRAAFFGPRGFFFGLRQYAGGGWIGVRPPSMTLFYARKLLADFGLPALLLAGAGLFGLERRSRRLLLALAPFPAVFLVLICTMSMVVVRNLYPVIPILTVLLGVAAAGSVTWLARWLPRRWAAAGVAAAALALPAAGTVQQTIAETRASTRELMSAWMREHLPPGAGILKESYTPNFRAAEFQTLEQRFAFRFPPAQLDDPNFDFLLLADAAYHRFLRPEHQIPHRAQWYRDVFARHRLLYRVGPDRFRLGPELRLYRLEGRAVRYARERSFTAADAYLPQRAMAAAGAVRFTRRGRFALFRGALAAGRYRVRAQDAGEGKLRVRDLKNALVAAAEIAAGEARVTLARDDKYLFYVELPVASTLTGLTIQAAGE